MAVDRYGNPIVKSKVGKTTKADYSGMTKPIPALVTDSPMPNAKFTSVSGANTWKPGLVVASEPNSQGWGNSQESTAQLPTIPQSIGTMQGLGNVPTSTGVPTLNSAQKWANNNLGTSLGFNTGMQDNSTFGYVQDGQQMYTGDLSSNPEAVNWLQQNPTGLSTEGTSSIWGKDGMASGIAGGIGAAANLANAYIGYKNYGLAKDKFGFEKAATNRNIENQAQQYNAELQNRADVGLALGGASISPEQRANTLAQMERQKISGAAIG